MILLHRLSLPFAVANVLFVVGLIWWATIFGLE